MRTVGDTSVPEQANTPLSRYATYGCPFPSGWPPVIARADEGRTPRTAQSATRKRAASYAFHLPFLDVCSAVSRPRISSDNSRYPQARASATVAFYDLRHAFASRMISRRPGQVRLLQAPRFWRGFLGAASSGRGVRAPVAINH